MVMSSVPRVKFIKTKVIFSCHNQGVSNQVSNYVDHEIKSYSCSNSSTKMEKRKKWENFFGLQNRAIRGLQIGAGFWYHKSGLDGLQIETALEISNRAIKLQIGAERKYLPDIVTKFE